MIESMNGWVDKSDLFKKNDNRKLIAHLKQKAREEKRARIQKEKEDAIKIKQEEKERLAREYEMYPEKALEIKSFRWAKGGFGTIGVVKNLKIYNHSDKPIKDFTLKMTLYSKSKTNLGSSSETVYQIVPPKKTLFIRRISIGFIDNQAYTSALDITDAVVVR